jgi:hypothetical protein
LGVIREAADVESRLAYAWFELQGRWCSRQISAKWPEALGLESTAQPAPAWGTLADALKQLAKTHEDLANWLNLHGLLLATPEFGLSRPVQQLILDHFGPGTPFGKPFQELRRQAIVDAFRQFEEHPPWEGEPTEDSSEDTIEADAASLLKQLGREHAHSAWHRYGQDVATPRTPSGGEGG